MLHRIYVTDNIEEKLKIAELEFNELYNKDIHIPVVNSTNFYIEVGFRNIYRFSKVSIMLFLFFVFILLTVLLGGL